ncbi:hypothetical protein SUGI_0429600 [Cryptomeria japonica]|nr:hypothetical protein SUGI_0429600 [Cryptomeria japonica]
MICGGQSKRKKNRHPKQGRPHEPCQSQSSFHSADDDYERSQHNYYVGNEDGDVDKAVDVFIHKFHTNLELQKSFSEARYQGYLERAI